MPEKGRRNAVPPTKRVRQNDDSTRGHWTKFCFIFLCYVKTHICLYFSYDYFTLFKEI